MTDITFKKKTHHVPTLSELTFVLESILEVQKHISKPPHIIHQLEKIVRIHSWGPHESGWQAHVAQRAGVLGAATHGPSLGGSGRYGFLGFGGRQWKLLDLLCPSASTDAAGGAATAAALP